MHTVFRWGLALIAVTTLVMALLWAFLEGRVELAREGEMEMPIKERANVARDAEGNAVVTISRDAQKRITLKTTVLVDTTLQPEVVAYGTLEKDPLSTYTLRAPITGILHSAETAWPEVTTELEDHFLLGYIQPILDPTQRVDLTARLAIARGVLEGDQARLDAARASFEHKKTLNKEGEGKIVSDRTLEEAEALVKTLEAKLQAAMKTVRVIEPLLTSTNQPDNWVRVEIGQGGQVVDIIAKRGEIVTANQAILRLARFDQLIARVELPVGETFGGTVSAARVLVLGYEEHPLIGHAIGVAPAVNPNTRGQAFLFRVKQNGFPIRPGTSVTAYLEHPGAPMCGVLIPRSAVVRAIGKAWAFVRISDENFVQREVATNHPMRKGWFTVSGFSTGDHVVVEGAQILLSEVFKSRIRVGEEEQ